MIYTNIDQVLLLVASFILQFTAYFTCQNFASKVLKDDGFDNLGFTCVALLYFMFASSSFFGGTIVHKMNNTRLTMTIGGLCYSGWIFSFLLPTYYS
jgi:hypothetical protein